MPAAKFTDAELVEFLNRGLTDREIAEKFDMRPESVATRRWGLGLPANRAPRRRHDWVAIARMYNEDFGPTDIGRALGINARVVVQILNKMRKRGLIDSPDGFEDEPTVVNE